jgi:hypothetical protein
MSLIAMSVGIGVVGVASNALAIYYLTRTETKTFFGKPSQLNPSTHDYLEVKFCTNCGKHFKGNESYCLNCGTRREEKRFLSSIT